jgi:3-oxoadipate enol-lactonase
VSFATINGNKIFYDQQGQGEDLVLICGLSAHHMTWDSLIPTLSKKYRILRLDNRGAGQSDVPNHAYTINDMAQDVNALMQQLGIQQAYVLGHSMGGMILQEMLLHHPHRIKKAMIGSSSGKVPAHSMLHLHTTAKLIDANVPLDILIENALSWLFGNAFLANPQQLHGIRELFRNNPYLQTKQGYDGQVAALSAFNLLEKLTAIQTKTLVFAGEDDLLIPPRYAELIHHQLPSSSFHVLKNAGHMLHLEQPDEFNKLICDFFN